MIIPMFHFNLPLLLLLLATATTNASPNENCESTDGDNLVDTSSSSSCSSNGPTIRGLAAPAIIVPPGTKLNNDARFPIALLGDWNRVLQSPDITVIADAHDDDDVSSGLIYTEGPLVRNEVVYMSDTVRAVIYRVSSSSSDSEQKQKNDSIGDGEKYYKFEIWATHSGGIDEDDPSSSQPSQYQNLAEPGSNGMATDTLDPKFVVINQHGLHRLIRCRLDDHAPGAPLSECPDLEVIANSFPVSSASRVGNDDQSTATTNTKPLSSLVRLNSPNDVVVHPHDGSIWFTDPIYGLLEKDRFCDEFNCDTGESYLDGKSEIGWQGVYRIDRGEDGRKDDDGSDNGRHAIDLVTKYHRRPNGLALTPDAKRLWVADSTIGSPSWTAYNVTPYLDSTSTTRKASDFLNPALLGSTLGRTEDLPPFTGGEGLSDGFKFDEQGYLWTSIPNGFAVIDTVKREVICQILLGVNTSNLAFGTNGDVWLTGKAGIWKITRRIE